MNLKHRTNLGISLAAVALFTACAPVSEQDPDESGETLGADTNELSRGTERVGGSLQGLSFRERASFAAGKRVFVTAATIADGLGPVFNERSCGACHDLGAPGGAGLISVTRFGKSTASGFDSLSSLGGSVIQAQGIGRVGTCDYRGEVVPPEANVTTDRMTTPIFGAGFVEAVPDATFRALAAAQPAEVRGRTNEVTSGGETHVGRFGWKAQVTTLDSFSSGAFLNEMGITSPNSPNEVCPQGNCDALSCNPAPGLNDDGTRVAAAATFMRLLAAPARTSPPVATAAGERAFDRLGCASCHTPALETGESPISALSNATFHPYSDFLLHDMGALGDGIQQGNARGSEMRTAPLWGIHLRSVFLHDGRATSIDDAIRAHAGQAATSRDRYVAAPAHVRRELVRFVRSL